MPFDTKYYLAAKAHTKVCLISPPWCYKGSLTDWVLGFHSVMLKCIEREDYEGAKAVKDAMIEFINEYREDKIPVKEIICKFK